MEPISGLALQIAVGGLFHVVEQNMDFKPLLSNVQEQLIKIQEVIKHIPPNAALEGVATIKKEIEDGEKLIEDCCKQRPWYKGVFKKSGLNKKLCSLEKSLESLVPKLTLYMVIYQTKLMADCSEKNILTKLTGFRSPPPKPPSFTVGLEKPLAELRKLIVEPGEPIIVITAPAGCGKTTLAQKLCHDEKIKAIFKANIFFVDVSEKPSLDHIVEQLFQQRGYRYILPAKTGNERCTGSYLEEFIEAEEQPLLLVLDGVSCDQKYNTLLQKFADLERPDLKILVTSRFHFPRFGLYYLNWLEEKDADDLFRHLALRGAKRTEFSDQCSPKIVQYCKGLPLAITIVGQSVCGQADEFWNKILQDQSILKSENDVHNKLKRSLEFLDTEEDILKNLFLDLAAFPEGRLISAAALIDMWSESYYEDDDTDTDLTCIIKLQELEHRTVVNLIFPRKASVYGYYSEHFVTQHEMLRELAIMQTRRPGPTEEGRRLFLNISGNQSPKELEQQKCIPKVRLLAISTDREQFSAKWQLPDVEVLVLNLQTIKFELPEFIKEMGKLKVVIITYYGSLPTTAKLSNFDAFTSLSSLKRVRLERISVPSIAEDLLQLKGVQKLSFFMCDIDQAFSNMSIKFSEALPKLEEMNINYCNDIVQVPTNICDHKLLKKLSITNCHELCALPEEIGKLENLQQLRLVACTNLSELPCSISKLRRLNLLDITDCLTLEKKLPPGIDFSVLKDVIRSHATN